MSKNTRCYHLLSSERSPSSTSHRYAFSAVLIILLLIVSSAGEATAFTLTLQSASRKASPRAAAFRSEVRTARHMVFGKLFEESGPLGKGITVGKVQVALAVPNRSSSSIFGVLESKARNPGNSPAQLSRMTNDVCLALLRKSSDWMAACSAKKWFGQNEGGKAESLYNDWTNREASKFEKEYVPEPGRDEKPGGSTIVVVSLIVEIQGDSTKFDGAGFSMSGTKAVLSSLASDCTVDGGYCLNAAEVFWTPSERSEVLTSRDVVLDFPELIDL